MLWWIDSVVSNWLTQGWTHWNILLHVCLHHPLRHCQQCSIHLTKYFSLMVLATDLFRSIDYSLLCRFRIHSSHLRSGPLPHICKWCSKGSHRVPKAREVDHSHPLVVGGRVWGFPQENLWILNASTCVFKGYFRRLGPDFSRFGHDLET